MKFKSHDHETDFELNLASIIDCFTVLITYLLVSASFISLGFLDVSVAGGDGEAVVENKPTVQVSVYARAGRILVLKLSGGEKRSITIQAQAPATPGAETRWNLEQLASQLKGIKERWSNLSLATVSAEDGVEYRDLVRVVEGTRSILPYVSLGEGNE